MNPGWYPDPDDPTARRYWDGQSWSAPLTEQAAPAAPLRRPAGWKGPASLVCVGLGVVLLIVGLVLGFGSVNRNGVDCGSAFGSKTDNGTVQDYEIALEGGPASTANADACASGISDRKTVALALVWPGAVLLFAAGVGGLLILSDRVGEDAAQRRAAQPPTAA